MPIQLPQDERSLKLRDLRESTQWEKRKRGVKMKKKYKKVLMI